MLCRRQHSLQQSCQSLQQVLVLLHQILRCLKRALPKVRQPTCAIWAKQNVWQSYVAMRCSCGMQMTEGFSCSSILWSGQMLDRFACKDCCDAGVQGLLQAACHVQINHARAPLQSLQAVLLAVVCWNSSRQSIVVQFYGKLLGIGLTLQNATNMSMMLLWSDNAVVSSATQTCQVGKADAPAQLIQQECDSLI